MGTVIDWSKAPLHATHWCPGNARIDAGWIYNPGGNKGEFYSCYGDNGLDHIPAFPNWRKARLIPRPSVATWAGEGLPPVGTVCEWRGPNSDAPDGWVYQESQVVGYSPCGLFVFMQAPSCWPVVQRIDNCGFRPIRTPKQIAAEEREAGITQMREMVGSLNTHPFAELWDAGYRKQVQL